MTQTTNELLDSILDAKLDSSPMHTDTSEIIPITMIEGGMDPRLKLLSHSSRSLLHSCPRKYQLYRQQAKQADTGDVLDLEQRVTFSYGHAVGIGVQSALEGKSESQCLIDTLIGWDTDLAENTPRQNKSIWTALWAVRKFVAMRNSNFLEDYELVYVGDKPAIELSFKIVLQNGYTYRGYVDAVLQHKVTKAVLVLENKTSSGKATAAMFRNSGQALGYSVILDILFPELSSYEVVYMVYETKTMEYKQLTFTKSLLQRALWLQELVIDTQLIDLYDSYGTYPMHGEACNNYFRPCEYLSLCTLTTENLTTPLTTEVLADIEEAEQDSKYDYVLTLEDLIASQIAKGD